MLLLAILKVKIEKLKEMKRVGLIQRRKKIKADDIFADEWRYWNNTVKRNAGKELHLLVEQRKLDGLVFSHKNSAGLAYYDLVIEDEEQDKNL